MRCSLSPTGRRPGAALRARMSSSPTARFTTPRSCNPTSWFASRRRPTTASRRSSGPDPNGTSALVVRAVQRAAMGAGVVGTGAALWVEAEPIDDSPDSSDRVAELAREYRAAARSLLEKVGGRGMSGLLRDVETPRCAGRHHRLVARPVRRAQDPAARHGRRRGAQSGTSRSRSPTHRACAVRSSSRGAHAATTIARGLRFEAHGRARRSRERSLECIAGHMQNAAHASDSWVGGNAPDRRVQLWSRAAQDDG